MEEGSRPKETVGAGSDAVGGVIILSNTEVQRLRRRMNVLAFVVAVQLIVIVAFCIAYTKDRTGSESLSAMWENTLSNAKYVDLTHAFGPSSPLWPAFQHATFGAAHSDKAYGDLIGRNQEFTYLDQGFIATSYHIPTDQYGTQLDPPAHWNEFGSTISDLPATIALRPLVVINIVDKVKLNASYHARPEDVLAWEREHGQVPRGSVVMFRTDWSLHWDDYAKYGLPLVYPGVMLDTLKILHLQRAILFHGHEPLDTDMTPSLEGEAWLMHNNFLQAEGVKNLHLVPEHGALVTIGFAKAQGGTGGLARFVAVCPPEWDGGATVWEQPGAPLPTQVAPLRRNAQGVLTPDPSATPTSYCSVEEEDGSTTVAAHPLGCPLPK